MRFVFIIGLLAVISAPSEILAQPADEETSIEPINGEFEFGSYGRIIAASDLDGGTGRQLNVVSHGPRLQESPYFELDLQYTLTVNDEATFRTLFTFAVTDALAHFNGDFDGKITLRNAYLEAAGFGVSGLSIWAGSRMYRGDDIYLLDFWPLDDLNTVGGGVGYNLLDDTTLALHVGMNRLDTPFQYQSRLVPAPQFGTNHVITLDRPRTIGSFRGEQRLWNIAGDTSAKIVVYTDYQSVGEGQQEDDNEVVIDLPSDSGFSAGLQLGVWGFSNHGFANLFLSYAAGLAAYDELAVPIGLDTDRRTDGAERFRVGASFNFEEGPIGVTGGGYLQRFTDADSTTFDPDDYLETALVLRPVIFVTDWFHQAFEASYQRRIPDGLSPRTDTYLEPAIWRFGVIPSLSLGRGVYERPQLRIIYAVSLLNEGATALFPEEDPRSHNDLQHFIGIGAEWWFNSSSY